MNIKKSILRGMALYGASTLAANPVAGKAIADTLQDLQNDAR